MNLAFPIFRGVASFVFTAGENINLGHARAGNHGNFRTTSFLSSSFILFSALVSTHASKHVPQTTDQRVVQHTSKQFPASGLVISVYH